MLTDLTRPDKGLSVHLCACSNIHEVHELGAHEFQRKYARIYGPIYQSWCFQGPEVVLASPELIRCPCLDRLAAQQQA